MMAGFDFSQIETAEPDKVDSAIPEEKGGFDFNQIETTEKPISKNKSRVANDPDNVFEPMPEGWNKGEDSYPIGEYGDALRRRDWEVMQTNKDQDSGEINMFEGAWQRFTKGYVGKAVDTLDYLIMKPVLSTASEAMEELGGAVASAIDAGDGSVAFDNDTGNKVRGYVKENAEELGKWWMTLDKQTRKNIEGTGLLASIMPVTFATKPAKAASQMASGTLRTTKKILETSLAKEKSAAALESITIPRSRLNTQQRFDRQANTDANGVYRPSSEEINEIKAVESLPNFKTKSSLAQRDFTIRQGVKEQSKTLDDILKRDGTVINPDDVAASIDKGIDSQMHQSTVRAGVPDSVLTANIDTLRDKANTAIRTAIDENNGVLDSLSLNKARQAFDRAVTEEKFDWGPNDYKLKDVIWKGVRRGMNDVIDDSVINRSVKARRENVSNLISARDKSNLVMQEHKVVSLYRNAFHAISGVGRTQYLGQILANAAAASGLTALAAGVKGGIAQAAVGAGLGFGAAYIGGRMVMSRKGRKIALSIISELDEAAKLAKTAAEKVAISKAKKDMIKMITSSTVITGGAVARDSKETEDDN